MVHQEFELRKHARQEGRRYCDPVVLTYQAERMPEQIRLKVSAIQSTQSTIHNCLSCHYKSIVLISMPVTYLIIVLHFTGVVISLQLHCENQVRRLAKRPPKKACNTKVAKLLQFIRIFSHFHSCLWVWNPKQCLTVGCALSLCALSLSLRWVEWTQSSWPCMRSLPEMSPASSPATICLSPQDSLLSQ